MSMHFFHMVLRSLASGLRHLSVALVIVFLSAQSFVCIALQSFGNRPPQIGPIELRFEKPLVSFPAMGVFNMFILWGPLSAWGTWLILRSPDLAGRDRRKMINPTFAWALFAFQFAIDAGNRLSFFQCKQWEHAPEVSDWTALILSESMGSLEKLYLLPLGWFMHWNFGTAGLLFHGLLWGTLTFGTLYLVLFVPKRLWDRLRASARARSER